MTTLIDYALMAGASYVSNRAKTNQFPAPDVWMQDESAYTWMDAA